MELLIKQRVFAWGDTYDVYDASGEPRYFVKAELFTFGHQIHVYEKRTNREVGSIHQKLFTMLPAFEIVVDGRVQGTIRKQFTLFRSTYDMDYLGWTCEGDLFGWDYQVMLGQRRVLSISKQLLHWGDTYVLDVADPADEIAALLLVLAIDAANCDK